MKRLLPSHPTAATAMQCILSPNEEGGHGGANVEGGHVGRQWRLMRDSRCEGEAALASHDHPTIRVASLLLILYPSLFTMIPPFGSFAILVVIPGSHKYWKCHP